MLSGNSSFYTQGILTDVNTPLITVRRRSNSIRNFLDDDEEVQSGRFHTLLEGIESQQQSFANESGDALRLRLGISVREEKGSDISNSAAADITAAAAAAAASASASAAAKTSVYRAKGKVSGMSRGRKGGKRGISAEQKGNGRTKNPLLSAPSHEVVMYSVHGRRQPINTPQLYRVPTSVKNLRQPPLQQPIRQQEQKEYHGVLRGTTVKTVSSMRGGGSTAPMVSVSEKRQLSSSGTREAVTKKRDSTDKQRQRRSFIESIAPEDDDPRYPLVSMGREREVRVKGKVVPTLKPLPPKTIKKLYTEDVAPFEKDIPPPPSSLPSNLSVDILQSTFNSLLALHGAPGDDLFSGYEAHSADDHSAGLSMGQKIRSLHAWIEPPSNVLLPDNTVLKEDGKAKKTGQRDVWYVGSYHESGDKGKAEWMRPLQEAGLTHEVESSVATEVGDGSLYHRPSAMDDDYQNLFQNLRRSHTGAHPTVYSSGSTREVIESYEVPKLPNSFAACSALLRQPQCLLDSEILTSNGSSARVPVLRTPHPPRENRWMTMFSGGGIHDSSSQALLQQVQFVELSHAAKVLYTAILYLRTLGGLPTLLRINPLTVNSTINGREHCIELTFLSATEGERTRADRSGPLGASVFTSQSWSNNYSNRGEKKEERIVVLRSVLAQKSVVERFGRREVVHVLPPLHESLKPMDETGGSGIGTSAVLASKSNAVSRLLRDFDGPSGLSERTTVQQRFGIVQSGGKQDNYGDIAVVFLMSAEASEMSGPLPEPMDLEVLRYKLFALRQHEFRVPDARKKNNSPMPSSDRIKQRRSSFEIELMKMTADASGKTAAQERGGRGILFSKTQEIESMEQRFPPYRAVTVAESTLAATPDTLSWNIRDWCQQEDDELNEVCMVPNFRPLRLPHLHEDLLGAVQFALDVQVRLAKEKVTRGRLF